MVDLKLRAEGYNFFAFLFFALPDDDFVSGLLSIDIADEAQGGMAMLRQFIDRYKDRDGNELLTDISVDRTYLIRGLTKEGPRPPYESVYCASHEVLGALNVIYAGAGFAVSGDTHEPPDYVGVEMSFMKELCAKELDAAENGDKAAAESFRSLQRTFFADHLGLWGGEFAEEIIKLAKTDFYRAVGHIQRDFIEEEKEILS